MLVIYSIKIVQSYSNSNPILFLNIPNGYTDSPFILNMSQWIRRIFWLYHVYHVSLMFNVYFKHIPLMCQYDRRSHWYFNSVPCNTISLGSSHRHIFQYYSNHINSPCQISFQWWILHQVLVISLISLYISIFP